MAETRALADALTKATEAAYGTAKLAPDGDATPGLVVQADDARLSDERDPAPHAASHASAGADAITPASIGAAEAAATTSALAGKADAAATTTALAGKAAASDLTAHVSDTTAAHAASAIGFTPTGDLTATDVQAAIAEAASSGGFENPLTTLGDMLIAGEGGVPTRLPKGPVNQHLITDPVTGSVRWEKERITNPMVAEGDLIMGGGTAIVDVALQSNGGSGFTGLGFQNGTLIGAINDGNAGTSARMVGAAPMIFGVTLSQAYTIVGYRLTQEWDNTYRFHITGFYLESSDDGNAWVIRDTVDSAGANPVGGDGPGSWDTGLRALNQGITAQYWRIRPNAYSSEGDIRVIALNVYGGTIAGHETRLAKGADSTVLTIDPTTHLPAWVAPSGGGSASFPAGGTTGQALVKASDADDDVAWGTVAGGGTGGTGGGGGGGGGAIMALDMRRTPFNGAISGGSGSDLIPTQTFEVVGTDSVIEFATVGGFWTGPGGVNDMAVNLIIDGGTPIEVTHAILNNYTGIPNIVYRVNDLAPGSHTVKVHIAVPSGKEEYSSGLGLQVVEYLAPGSAGGGSVPYPDTPGADGAGFAEEFGSTSPSGWAWSPSTPTTADVNTTVPDAAYVRSTDGTERLYLKSWAASGAFDLRAKINVIGEADNGSLSLYCDDGATSGKRLLLYSGDVSSASGTYIQFYTASAGSLAASGSNRMLASGVFVPRYYRLVRDGANLVTAYYSHDGILWLVLGTPVTLAGTFTRVGLRSANAAHRGYCSWIRANV